MKSVLKISVAIEEKNTKPVYLYPSAEEIVFHSYSKAKLNEIFHSNGTVTISVWYLKLFKYKKFDPDNQIICKCWEDFVYAREAFIKEYLK